MQSRVIDQPSKLFYKFLLLSLSGSALQNHFQPLLTIYLQICQLYGYNNASIDALRFANISDQTVIRYANIEAYEEHRVEVDRYVLLYYFKN